jgi:hypothetical protein
MLRARGNVIVWHRKNENDGSAAMTAVKPSLTALPCLLVGLMSLLVLGRAVASDNSNSTLEVLELLALAGSRPISNVAPPPIVIIPKPPSLQVLRQQLATDQQALAEQQSGLTMAQGQLAFWQTQPPEVAQINVPQWMEAVASDQHTVATFEAQIAQLLAQIESTP